MKYKIQDLASAYAKEQLQVSDRIQKILKKNNIEIYSESPTAIHFIPWPIQNALINENVHGTLSWNPLSRRVSISYHIHVHYEGDKYEYSRVLKWYLLMWNEKREYYSRHMDIRFLYLGDNNTEIVLQASRKTTSNNMDEVIQMILLQLHDILEQESSPIIDILARDPPDEMKKYFLEEIEIIIAELNGA